MLIGGCIKVKEWITVNRIERRFIFIYIAKATHIVLAQTSSRSVKMAKRAEQDALHTKELPDFRFIIAAYKVKQIRMVLICLKKHLYNRGESCLTFTDQRMT